MDDSDRISNAKDSQEEPHSSSSPQASEPSSSTPSTPCSAEPQNIFSSSASSSSSSSSPDSAGDASNADSTRSQSDWRIPQHDDPYTFLDPDEYFAQARPKRTPTSTSRTPTRATPTRATPSVTAEDSSGGTESPQFTSPPRYTAQDQSKRTYYHSLYSTNFRRRHRRSDSDDGDLSSYGSSGSDEDDDDNYVAFDWKPLKLQALVIVMCHLLGFLLSVALHLSFASTQWISYLSYVVATAPSLIGSPVQRTKWSSAAITLFALSKLFFPPIKPHLHGIQTSSSALQSWVGSLLWTVLCVGPHALGTTSSKQESTLDDEDDEDEASAKRIRKRAKRRALLMFLTACGVAWESMADMQQRQFYRTHAATEYCFVGLWTFAQYPDVLGSLCLWIGVWASHVEALVDPAGRPSSRQRVARRLRLYAQRYWRVVAATLLLAMNVGTQWGQIAGFLGTRADTTHIHFGYGVDPVYTAFVDTVPLLWGTVAFDPRQHRDYIKKKKRQSFQNGKEARGTAGRGSSTKVKSKDSSVGGAAKSSRSKKKETKVPADPVGSGKDSRNDAHQPNRPLDDIVRWYAILEERFQDYDLVRAGDDGAFGPHISSATNGDKELSRGSERQSAPHALTSMKSFLSSDSTERNDKQSTLQPLDYVVDPSSKGAEEWKQKILELVKSSKKRPREAAVKREEVERTSVDIVFTPSDRSTPVEPLSGLPSDGSPATTGDPGTEVSHSDSIRVSVLSMVDSGAFEELTPTKVGELPNDEYTNYWLRYLSEEEDTRTITAVRQPELAQRRSRASEAIAVGTQIVDKYEASLREAMEAFEVVVRSMADTSRKVVSSERTADSSLSFESEQEDRTSSKSTGETLTERGHSSEPASTSSSGRSSNVNLGPSRANHDNLDAIAAKLVADSVAKETLRHSRREALDAVNRLPPETKQHTPLPHTRMGASRPSLTAQVNHLLSKYVISADESFEQFVTRHQKALKKEVLEHSSRLSRWVSTFQMAPSSWWTHPIATTWSEPSVSWLEPLRVHRLRDLWLLDDEDDVEELDRKSTLSVKKRHPLLEKLRVDRLVDLWNIDLESEMNVREEPPRRNPFESLRVDRLRDLWLLDDD